MRPSAGTPYLARVPETQLGSPHAPQDREAAISVVAPASCITPPRRRLFQPRRSPDCRAADARLGQATPGVQAARRKAAAIGPAAQEQYGHNESRLSLPGNSRRPVGCELNGVFFQAAESSETSIRC